MCYLLRALCFFIANFVQKTFDMDRGTLFSSIFVTLFMLVSCSSTPEREPAEVAVQLFNSLTSGDVQYVKDNIYFADAVEREVFNEYLDMAVESEDFAERTKGYTADYRVLSQSVHSDSAFVELRGYTVLGQMTRFKVLLVKVDGCWKVDGRSAVLTRQ